MRLLGAALAAALGLWPSASEAAFGEGSAGTSAGEFLKFGPDARGVGMGHAMTAAADDASAIYWNPAGLSQVKQREWSMSGAQVFQDVTHGFIGYAHPVRPLVPARRRELRPAGHGTLGAGLLYLNAGRLEEFTNDCATAGDACRTGTTFTPRDLALLAGWGASVTEMLDIGISLKYIDSRIKSVSRTGSADLGARLRFLWGDFPYTVALNARNVFGNMRFHEQKDPLPFSYRIGQTLKPFPYWVLSSDFVFPRDNDFYLDFGSEARLPELQGVSAVLRGGWSGRTSPGDLDGTNGMALGAGLSYGGFQLDFAWAPFGELGDLKRYSLRYRF